MKYLMQLVIIAVFSLVGELLQAVIPLPIPAAIYGLILMLLALCTGLLKPERIADSAHFLISLMPLLFVAPAVNLLKHWGVIQENLAAILIIVISSTILVFAVGGLVTQWLRKKGGKDDG